MANDILTEITSEVQNTNDIDTLEALEDEVIDRMARAKGSFKQAWAGVLGTIRGRMKRMKNPASEDAAKRLAARYSLKELQAKADAIFDKAVARRAKLGEPDGWSAGAAGPWYDMTEDEREKHRHLKLAIALAEKTDRAGARARILARRAAAKKNPGNRYIFTFAPHKNNKRRLRWIRYGKNMEAALAAAKRAARADYPHAHGFLIMRDETMKNPKRKVTYRTKAGYERVRSVTDPKRTKKARPLPLRSPTGSGRRTLVLARGDFQGQVKKIETKTLKASVTRLNKEVSVHVPSTGTVTHRYKTEAAAKSAYKSIRSVSAAMRFMARYI